MNTDAWAEKEPEPVIGAAVASPLFCGRPNFPHTLLLCLANPCPCSSQPSNSTASFPLFLSTRQPQGHAPIPSAPMSHTNDSTPVISAAWVRPSYEGAASGWLRGSFVRKEAQAGCETVLKRSSSSRCQAHQPWQVEDERCKKAVPEVQPKLWELFPCMCRTGVLPTPHVYPEVVLSAPWCSPPPPPRSSLLTSHPSSALTCSLEKRNIAIRGVQSPVGIRSTKGIAHAVLTSAFRSLQLLPAQPGPGSPGETATPKGSWCEDLPRPLVPGGNRARQNGKWP